jgi:hypothetical protein
VNGGREFGAAKTRVVIVEDPRLTAQSMIEHDEADVYDLWLQYFANGGNALQFGFETFLYGITEPSALDQDLLGLAIEELHSPRKFTEPGY